MYVPVAAKVALCLVAAIAVGVFLAELASWSYVHFYEYKAGVSLDKLSEVYAMGFYGILIQVGVFLASSIGLFIFLIKRYTK